MRHSSSPDVAMLLLLVALPTHAADLERALAALGYVWSSSETVRSRLKRLAREGLVSSTWDTPKNDRPRLIYSITEAGMVTVRRMVLPRYES